MSNVVTATFTGKSNSTHARTEALWQYDYGMMLKLEGLELPPTYEVHFSDSANGYSKTSFGDANGVPIPDEYLLSGKQVHAWIFLHTGNNDGETQYSITIPVNKRARPTDEVPTPVQRNTISEMIALLNHAVEECEGCVEHYPKIVDNHWYVWYAQDNNFVDTGVDARGLKGDTGAVYTPDVTLSGVISWTNNGGLPNPAPVDLTQAVHLEDYATKEEVNQGLSDANARIDGKIDVTEKGIASGVASLDSEGKIFVSQLPSYVDDVLEFSSVSTFPSRGETGKIYISTSNNTAYRWTGSQYVSLSGVQLGETSATAYRGDRGKVAYDHASARGTPYNLGLYKIQTNIEGHVTAASVVTLSDLYDTTGILKYQTINETAGFDGLKGQYYLRIQNYTGDIRPGQTSCFFESHFCESPMNYGTQTIIWLDGKRSTRTYWNGVFSEWHTET